MAGDRESALNDPSADSADPSAGETSDRGRYEDNDGSISTDDEIATSTVDTAEIPLEEQPRTNASLISSDGSNEPPLEALFQAVIAFEVAEVRILVEDRLCPVNRQILKPAAIDYFNKAVLEILAVGFAAQMAKLLQHARGTLQQYDLRKFDIQDEQTILDFHSGEIAAELHSNGYLAYSKLRNLFADIFKPSPSVYTLVESNLEAAQILYDAGFHDVQPANKFQEQSIVSLKVPQPAQYHGKYHGKYKTENDTDALSKYIKMCDWYKERSANMTLVSDDDGSTPLHCIAGHIGRYLAFIVADYTRSYRHGEEDAETAGRRFRDHWASAVKPMIKNSPVYRMICRDTEHRDIWSCPCSERGCLPADILLCEVFRTYFEPDVDHFKFKFETDSQSLVQALGRGGVLAMDSGTIRDVYDSLGDT
ncbi:uncharacterized protein BDV14DRAFT_201935 [Aspergillus stella-maris]|uniref:uncharacterized protein n=1 Tax=Aspergillus stella-maris TaxID=1810926 RepID=UPI003CCE2EE5